MFERDLLVKLKDAGVSIHVIATGAGTEVQERLWCVPGSSAYLSGCSFPYAQEEQEELLGFTPEHFCSEEAAVDLASTAYMRAYRFGGKAPVGVGVTASVTSDKNHRGQHRVFICIMTDTGVHTSHLPLLKKTFTADDPYSNEFEWRCCERQTDDYMCNEKVMQCLFQALNIGDATSTSWRDATALAQASFWNRPFFTADGKRHQKLFNKRCALMPGAYNPPHEGHYGMADSYERQCGGHTVFTVTTNPPHKSKMTVQDCLKRAKLLGGKNRIFTMNDPYYIDKARLFPGTPILIGADAFLRMFDPKWGQDLDVVTNEFSKLGTHFYVCGREVDGKFMRLHDVLKALSFDLQFRWSDLVSEIEGRWDVSSTVIRNKHKV
jgi:nicotinamide mononucleotide (NMN) deamidase PncC